MGAAVLLLFFGCNSGSRDVNNVTIPRVEYERLQAAESRRFQPFTEGVALDTQSGQYCKTHEWHSGPVRREYTGPISNPYENAPLCRMLVRENAGSADVGDITISRAEYERLQAAQQHRFQPFSNLSGVALDTQTGQVCKTSERNSQTGVLPNARGIPHTGRVPRTAMPSSYENAPLCADLH